MKRIEDEIDELTGGEKGYVEEVKVGDTVKIKAFGKEGIVQEIKDDTIKVSTGNAIISVSKDMIQVVRNKNKKVTRETDYIPSVSSTDLHTEIDVRGKSVEEAVELVDDFLNTLYSNDIHMGQIIHGKGTGKLRRGIWDFLSKHLLVKSFRMGVPHEGGSGVTIVEVK